MENMIFEGMNVLEEVNRAVIDMGYTELTPIQKQTIPLLLEGNDVIGQSQTGTGKTAAFAIPILQKINPELRKPQALILCPTRELAVQVANEFRKLTKYLHGIKAVAIYGGEPINRQIYALKGGAQIIIGTPGRTIDHINRHTIRLTNIHTVVLDEADEMLKMGFREDIELILEGIPEGKQMVLFSATMPKSILDITKKYQKDPKLVKIQTDVVTAETIDQEYCEVLPDHKTEALCRILDVNKPTRCIVFCNKKKIVDEVADSLIDRGYTSEKIHGDLKQEHRMNVLSKFNSGKIDVMVATDVAARGLDIQEVDLIINYDVPEKEDYYVHRIGRSGRAGKKGRSITLVTKAERRLMQEIMEYTNKSIQKHYIPTIEEVNDSNIESFLSEVISVVEEEGLERYLRILDKVDKEKYSMEKIAAALIKMNVMVHEQTELNDINVNFSDYKTKRTDSNRKRTFRSEGKGRMKPGSTRVFINIGKKDGVKASHILGAIVGECGIHGSKVGSIDILDKFSFVDIEDDSAKKVLKKLKNAKIKDKKVNVEIATGK